MAEAKAGTSPADRELIKANYPIHGNIDSLVFLFQRRYRQAASQARRLQ